MQPTSRLVKVVLGAATGLCAATTANIAAIPATDPVARLAGRWPGDAGETWSRLELGLGT